MNIVLTGGGTAGHIIPNLALIEDLKQHFDNIYYIGNDNQNERKLVEDYKIPFYEIHAPKLIRKLTFKNFKIPFQLLKCVSKCKKLLKQLNPEIIFSKGGYVALPVIIAAHKLNIKIIIHESDTTMGLSNKICAKYSDKICTTFPTFTKSQKFIQTGAPIRKNFFNPKYKKLFDNNKKTILFLGGSLGALSLNNFVFENIDELIKSYNIIHICGKGKAKKINKNNYLQFDFYNEISTLINSSDLIVTRGGANSLCEILCVNKPMIIVPLSKKISRGEQIENAKYFAQHNYACYKESLEINNFVKCANNILNKKAPRNQLNKYDTDMILNGNHNIINQILNCVNNK